MFSNDLEEEHNPEYDKQEEYNPGYDNEYKYDKFQTSLQTTLDLIPSRLSTPLTPGRK